ncbi:MAG: hypothetical protein OJJ21_11065 [Ferrovibrio sp.]|uniref:hypothetical protein n=1 Tax=Ferrovibrio sp. TaxID=1917215 RepID=UPI00261FEC64|nr:hypothetical protein [Ferrovibrio sp.]MCW0234130.1 hypothetical protein [Ferrovibrio sp.]
MILEANPVLQTALEFWRDLPKPVNIPDIRLLDVAAIPRALLPHLIIAETTNANFDLSRLRLVGAEIARWFREMPEGMDARAYGALTDPAYIRHMRDLMAELIQRRKPIYCRSVYTLPGLTEGDAENIVTAERLVLPLADGATAVECVIVVETLHASDSRAGPIRMLPPEPGIRVQHDPFEPVA